MFPCNKLATPTIKETGNHRIPRHPFIGFVLGNQEHTTIA